MKIIPIDDYNRRIPPSYEWDYIGAVIPNFGVLAARNGWKIIEYEEPETDSSGNA